jgi:glycosyltransferase involved in cell wall biosynthesis
MRSSEGRGKTALRVIKRAGDLSASVLGIALHGVPFVVTARASVVGRPPHRESLTRGRFTAKAAGTPIMATDIEGCGEVARNGVNDSLVSPRNPEALAASVNRLLESQDLRTRFGAAGRGIAVQEFAEEIVVKQTLDVFRELLGECWPGSR